MHSLSEVAHRFRRQEIVLPHLERPWCELTPLQIGLDLLMLLSLVVGGPCAQLPQQISLVAKPHN